VSIRGTLDGARSGIGHQRPAVSMEGTQVKRRASFKTAMLILINMILLWPVLTASARAQYTFSPFPQPGLSNGPPSAHDPERERERRERADQDRQRQEQEQRWRQEQDRQRQEQEQRWRQEQERLRREDEERERQRPQPQPEAVRPPQQAAPWGLAQDPPPLAAQGIRPPQWPRGGGLVEAIQKIRRPPRAAVVRPAVKPPPRDDSARPAMLLRMARALEKDGRIPQAIRYHKEIVEKYPESTEAKTAAERIEALGREAQMPSPMNMPAR
jgi:TolA-binding protein